MTGRRVSRGKKPSATGPDHRGAPRRGAGLAVPSEGGGARPGMPTLRMRPGWTASPKTRTLKPQPFTRQKVVFLGRDLYGASSSNAVSKVGPDPARAGHVWADTHRAEVAWRHGEKTAIPSHGGRTQP